ncbi:alpha-L-rhamnosidase C-terminal domain-containing protein [Saccharibacillus sacchari]|uniref:Alpha-L-rhamnosidase C-terminal domain-containing protein n=1 Tax=Saccharibacillus sacchari TaxID=456493 RepID=A0ACC6PEI6_9BACL
MIQEWKNIKASKDPRMTYFVHPVRIVWQTTEASAIDQAGLLLSEKTAQPIHDSSRRPTCVMHHDGQAPGIVLDFGVELHGGLELSVGMGNNSQRSYASFRIRFGESVMECMSELGGDTNATNDHAMRDLRLQVPYMGAERIGNTGFRFIRIDFTDEHKQIQLIGVRAIAIMHDLEYRGSFRSSDPLLDRIWSIGAYTVHLNMQEYLWDGIKRDRLIWAGDMHPETSVIQAVFGYHDVVPRSLDFIRDEYPLPEWMTTFPTYSVWWILVHHDWYMHNGDRAYLMQQHAYMTALLRQLADGVDAEGKVNLPNPFLDWPSSTNPQGLEAGVHALLIWCMDAGIRLCGWMDDAVTAELCSRTAQKLRQVRPDCNKSKQAASLLVLAGQLEAEATNKLVIAPGSPEGYSTFYGYYLLKARGEAGDIQGSLDSIRQYWGGMLELGATTFWEDFDLAWLENAARIDEVVPEGKVDVHGTYGGYCYQGYRHSLCHGWASGPTAWLSEYVLGIRVEEPGCRTLRISPALGNLQWVEGTFPTPYGTVYVKHEKADNGTIVSTVQAPDEIQIIRA